jgi:hypothetical protein
MVPSQEPPRYISKQTNSQVNYPNTVTLDASQNIYISDYYNGQIRKITAAGVMSSYASVGNPVDVAVDSVNGDIYVARLSNIISKVTSAGVVTDFAGSGSSGYIDATGTSARFSQPRGVAVDLYHNVYVADCSNNRIRMITSAGVVRY